MCTVILLIALIVLSAFGIIIANKKYLEVLKVNSTIVFLFCITTSIVCVIKYCTVKSDTEKFIYEYNSTSAIIKDTNMESYGNLPELTKKILNINKEIARYRANNKNPWLNIWFPEEIGKLEPLTFKIN